MPHVSPIAAQGEASPSHKKFSSQRQLFSLRRGAVLFLAMHRRVS